MTKNYIRQLQKMQCESKVRYKTRGKARKQAKQMRGIEAYNCEFCDGFHVGHSKKNKRYA